MSHGYASSTIALRYRAFHRRLVSPHRGPAGHRCLGSFRLHPPARRRAERHRPAGHWNDGRLAVGALHRLRHLLRGGEFRRDYCGGFDPALQPRTPAARVAHSRTAHRGLPDLGRLQRHPRPGAADAGHRPPLPLRPAPVTFLRHLHPGHRRLPLREPGLPLPGRPKGRGHLRGAKHGGASEVLSILGGRVSRHPGGARTASAS